MIAAAIIWIGLCLLFALLVGVALGRSWERKDRGLRDRLLDEADRDIAGMHVLDALERIHRNSQRVPVKW